MKPNVSMRQLHWGKLADAKIRGTIWEAHVDEKSVKLEYKELEAFFAAAAGGGAAAAATEDEAADKKKSGIQKKEYTSLLDPKSANNMAIALSRFKKTPAEISASLTAGDVSAFSPDQLNALLAILPSTEDVELVQSYEGPVEQLGKPEMFILAMASVPRYAIRTRCLQTQMTFDEKARELGEAIKLVSNAVDEIRSSSALKNVLAHMLAMGNYLNGGTSKGAAWGFKLESLSKVIGTKTVDGKSTLLHYLARTLAKVKDDSDGPSEATMLSAQMPSIEAATRVVWQDEAAELNAITNSLKQVETQVKLDKVEAFTSSMGAFLQAARGPAESLSESYQQTDQACKSLREWFGEDPKSPPEHIFGALHNFTLVLEKAHKYNVECDERERKKAQMADAAAKRRASLKDINAGGVQKGPPLGFAPNEELAAKLAKRSNLVDNVEIGMANGRLLKQRRQQSFERRKRNQSLSERSIEHPGKSP